MDFYNTVLQMEVFYALMTRKDDMMPKKKGSTAVPAMQVVFRIPADLHDALQTAASGLGIDLSNLLRMMIAEHVPEYIGRGRRAANRASEQARAKVQQGDSMKRSCSREGDRIQRLPSGGQKRSIIVDAVND